MGMNESTFGQCSGTSAVTLRDHHGLNLAPHVTVSWIDSSGLESGQAVVRCRFGSYRRYMLHNT